MRQMHKLLAAIVLGWMIVGAVNHAAAEDPLADVPSNAALTRGTETKALRVLLKRFDDWAAIQKTYDAEQTKAFRARLMEKASQLSGSDYQRFFDDLEDRLQVLLSAEAREARSWLERMEAVSAPKRMEKIKSQMPDVAHMTASEIREQLGEFDRRLGAQREQYNRFERDRSLAIERAQSAKRRQEEESRVAREAASHDSIELGANQSVSPRVKRRHVPRPPVYGGYVPYDPNVGEIYSPYFAPSLRSVYNPDLGGYRW